MRKSLAVLTGTLALVAAGCGGGGGSGSGGDPPPLPAGSSIVPASTPVLVTFNTDSLGRFPALAAQLQKQLPKGLTLSAIQGAVGPEVDVAALGYENEGSGVALTQPRNKAKLAALVAKSKPRPVSEEIEGWTVFAQTQKQLDQFDAARKNGTLDGSSAFKDAMQQVPSGAGATVFVDGKSAQDYVDGQLSKGSSKTSTSSIFGTLDWFVASAVAKTNGVAITGDAHASLKDPPEPYHPTLAAELPAGAVAYASFAHLDKPLGQLYKVAEQVSPSFEKQLNAAEGLLGFSIEDDVLPIFSGEGALAVYPTKGKAKAKKVSVPRVALVEKVSDESKVRSLLDRLTALAGLAGGTVKASSTTIAGVPAQKFVYEGTTAYAAVFDGKLVVTNVRSIVGRIHGGSGPKLAEDPAYKAAASAAGLPSDVLGLVYLNLRTGLPAVLRIAKQTGTKVPKAARANTKPLRSALVYATADGNDYRLGGFVTIK